MFLSEEKHNQQYNNQKWDFEIPAKREIYDLGACLQPLDLYG